MIYFCADDYGISKTANTRIEECLVNGVLNKISVLPNGDIQNFKERLLDKNVKLSLHINLVEGYPLSNKEDVSLLVSKDGSFKYSFVGLFFLSLFSNKKLLEKQLYNEIKAQIGFWQKNMGEKTPILLDSHQHVHMIPLIFKTLLKVIKDEGVDVEYIRIPNEPIIPYLKCASLYFKISPVGIIKQWLLKFLNLFNRGKLKRAKIDTMPFMGILFSGQLTEEKIEKLLPHYNKLGNNLEIAFHPGYLDNNDFIIDGCREDFKKFYHSKWRKIEYETLLNLKHYERRS